MADGTEGEDKERNTIVQDMMKKLQDMTNEERYTLQCVCREQMIAKLLADIATDMQVCELEGWDKLAYIRRIHDEMSRFLLRHGLGDLTPAQRDGWRI